MHNRALTDEQLRHQAKKAGVEEIYDEHLSELTAMLDRTIQNGNGDLAGFLFAFSSLANEITRRKRNNFRPN